MKRRDFLRGLVTASIAGPISFVSAAGLGTVEIGPGNSVFASSVPSEMGHGWKPRRSRKPSTDARRLAAAQCGSRQGSI